LFKPGLWSLLQACSSMREMPTLKACFKLCLKG